MVLVADRILERLIDVGRLAGFVVNLFWLSVLFVSLLGLSSVYYSTAYFSVDGLESDSPVVVNGFCESVGEYSWQCYNTLVVPVVDYDTGLPLVRYDIGFESRVRSDVTG